MIVMKFKSKQKIPDNQVHRLPAGIIPGDFNTELIGLRETRKVFGIYNGNTIPFSTINPVQKATIYAQMLADDVAMNDLKGLPPDEALEEYAFCLYGQADHNPDFLPDGTLGQPENFICGGNCRCTKWTSKSMTINGNRLTNRQVQIINELCSDDPDKAIADRLNIAMPTLRTHKQQIFALAGVQSKTGLARVAINNKVVQ